jgi:peptide chain release factor 1
MFERLQEVEARYEELEHKLADPAVAGDHEKYAKVHKELVSLREIVETFREYRDTKEELAGARELLRENDDELKELARADISELEPQIESYEEKLKRLMLPTDPLDEKNIILEIRAGTGGDESALFAGDLLDMYNRYASNRGWKVELLDASSGTMGGYKEVIAMISGERVYSNLKWESGVHRVQRVPETETQGRIHTSACTVAILPEADDVEVNIDPSDLRIDTYRASGAGGQHVNRTDSAIRITHEPTGLVVTCQDEKSQHKNREKALKVLKSRLFDMEKQRQQQERASERKTQIGSGDRSERIRTYNFPQNRVTDHRINLTLYDLDSIIEGELQEVVDALNAEHQARQLKAQEEGLV